MTVAEKLRQRAAERSEEARIAASIRALRGESVLAEQMRENAKVRGLPGILTRKPVRNLAREMREKAKARREEL